MTTPKQPQKTKMTSSNGLPEQIGGVKVPAFLRRIPLPILGGGVALIGMVLYVFIVAATMPVPEGSIVVSGKASIEPVPPSMPPSATEQVTTTSGSSTSDSVPVYQGPVGDTAIIAADVGGLPIIERLASPIPDLGRKVLMSQDEFNEQTQEESSAPGLMSPLGYRLRLPKQWTAKGGGSSSVQGTQGVTNNLAEYVSPPSPTEARSRVRILSEKMLYAMPLVDWVRAYAFDKGLVIQAMSSFGPDRVEAVYMTTQTEETEMVRFAAVRNGAYVMMAEYAAPIGRYEQEKDMQTWVIASFYPPVRDSSAPEPLAHMAFYDLAGFSYYKSWALQNQNMADTSAMSVSLMLTKSVGGEATTGKVVDIIQGRIDVFALSKSTLAHDQMTTEGYVQKWLGLQSLHLSAPIGQFTPPDNLRGLTRTGAKVYNLTNIMGDYQKYQYFTVTFEGQSYIYHVGLMTLPQTIAEAAVWARAHAALDYVVMSLHEGNE